MGNVTFAIVLDCHDPDRLARFWAQALGYKEAGRDDPYILLVPERDSGPEFVLQRVGDPKTAKNRMHLDIRTGQHSAEVARLIALGARRLGDEVREGAGDRWVVMADPEGNEFCVCTEV